MNRIIFAVFALISTITLSGCIGDGIRYTGTSCELSDSARYYYNVELEIAYRQIDSSTLAMLKERGPKVSRGEDESVSDEYKGARKFMEDAKESREQVLRGRYCTVVDNYTVTEDGASQFFDDFKIPASDTATFHKVKRDFILNR